MPCQKCGNIRIITEKKVMCPKCNGITLKDPQKSMEDRKDKLEKLKKSFLTKLKETNYNQTFGSAVLNRELAAKTSILSPIKRRDAIKNWLALSLILRNLRFVHKDGVSNFLELVDLSKQLVDSYNELSSLSHGFAVIMVDGEKERFEWTEKEPMLFIPEEALTDETLTLDTLEISERKLNAEVAFLQEGLMEPIQTVLLSEELSRLLKQNYHSQRILPFIQQQDQAKTFVEISKQLAITGIESNVALGRQGKVEGIFATNDEGLEETKANLCENYSVKDVNWLFEGLVKPKSDDKIDFGCPIVVNDRQLKVTCFPLYSLLMLSIANMKWVKDVNFGRALNFKGSVIEEYLYRVINGYDLNLNHPLTNKPLLRVAHPENAGIEIADIMGYDDKTLVVVESKFWDSPNLEDLESEICKFEQKIVYIERNLSKFGFPEKLCVIPIFYTPFAPYHTWKNITITPSALTLASEIGKHFSTRKVELQKGSDETKSLLNKVTTPTPLPIDAATIIPSIKKNTHTVHDVLVLEFDEEEVTVLLDLPQSLYGYMSYFDISKEVFGELKNEVEPGDIIRAVTANLNGTWSLLQLLHFKKLMKRSDWEKSYVLRQPYSKVISLFENVEEDKKERKTVMKMGTQIIDVDSIKKA
jgi:hypothetical protein